MNNQQPTAPPQHNQPVVKAFFDECSSTFSYVVSDATSSACAVIDSVLEFDQASGTLRHDGADQIIDYIVSKELQLQWILETHVHADHLSAAPYIQQRVGGLLAIGSAITVVQKVFGNVFNEGNDFKRDGSQFDQLLDDEASFTIGHLQVKALHTPGHTPACMTFSIGDALFVGDTLFMPDGGTARADFPRLSAQRPGFRVPKHGRQRKTHEHTCGKPSDPRRFRSHARSPGQNAGHASVDPAGTASEYARRPPARSRAKRASISETTYQCFCIILCL